MHYKLVLLGFGNVGKAFARLLIRKKTELLTQRDMTFSVTGIATGKHRSAIDPDGIDLENALRLSDGGESLTNISKITVPENPSDFINFCNGDILFENTPVNYKTGQPAIDFIKIALECGMHAITANKGPVVFAYKELNKLAYANGRKFFFESAVMDGAPLFSLFREALPCTQLQSFEGVLNSTTNLILSRMEEGEGFNDAVSYAQSIGIAETDPSGDVDGWDAAIKVAVLVTVLMGVDMKPDQVKRQGIRQITLDHIAQANTENKRWKLVCSAERVKGEIQARVTPRMVAPDSPLYGINGTTSIVQFKTDVLGQLSIIEEDPGPNTTAYGLLADFLNAVK